MTAHTTESEPPAFEVTVTAARQGRRPAKAAAWLFSTRPSFPLHVAAFNDFAPAYAKVIGSHDIASSPLHVNAVLLPEPTNRHDPNAVMIQADGGYKLGYLYSTQAVSWQPVIDEFMRWFDLLVACRAVISGVPRSYSLALNLTLDDLLAEQARRLALQRRAPG